MTGQLPVWDTINAAWAKVAGSKGTFWAAIIIMFLIMFGIGILEGVTEKIFFISSLLGIIGSILGYFLQLGLVYIGITRAKDMPINYKLVFTPFDVQLALNLVGLYVLQTVIFLIPAIVAAAGIFLYMTGSAIAMFIGGLLVIASIVALLVIAVRLSISMAYVLDASAGPRAAIKSSLAATEGNFWNLVGIYILQMLILLVSILPAGIGLIWSIPFVLICYGMVYKQLR